MILAVASGKGGTGKTSVSASLALVWPACATLVDLDVEEPNLHLLLNPSLEETRPAFLAVPAADESLCNACGACGDICQFKAVSVLGETLLLFPEMCHGCGGCLDVCPTGALAYGERQLGEVIRGMAGRHSFYMGRLRVSEAMSPPLMKQVMALATLDGALGRGDVIIDAPPGVSCPAVTAVGQADVVLLVTEPTPFGLYDLRLAHKAFGDLGKPMAVVINRAGMGDLEVNRFCESQGLPILAEIPHSIEVARAYSAGIPPAGAGPEMEAMFKDLARAVKALDPTAGARMEAAHA